MVTLIDVLLANLDEGYSGKGWHGPALRATLRGLTTPQLLWRPKPGRHTIWELAAHCAYWKFAVRRRLTGEKRGKFPMKGGNWPSAEANALDAALRVLHDEHKQLRAVIAALPPKSVDFKRARLIYGVTAHDLYHAGQIQLLKRLQS